ncbi:Alpha/Beta hydrolase protein [Syncephalis fuscata]|nr:Alpha/Beta hydrolase protein [Syncephalis fuscata]
MLNNARVLQVGAGRLSQPLNIFYEIHGTGNRRVLFICGNAQILMSQPGLGSTRIAWRPQALFLARHDCQACIFDNRGMGDSGDSIYETMTALLTNTPKIFPPSLIHLANDTAELLDHLGWKSNVHLFGVSLGGYIAQELASLHPAYFSSLCLTSTFANPGDPLNKPSLNRLKEAVGLCFDEFFERMIFLVFPEKWLSEPSKNKSEMTNYALIKASLPKQSPAQQERLMEGVRGQFHAASTGRITKKQLHIIRKSKINTLVCTGDVDQLILPFNAEYISKVTCAPLRVFKGCGHDISLQEFKQYCQTILEHINGTID